MQNVDSFGFNALDDFAWEISDRARPLYGPADPADITDVDDPAKNTRGEFRSTIDAVIRATTPEYAPDGTMTRDGVVFVSALGNSNEIGSVRMRTITTEIPNPDASNPGSPATIEKVDEFLGLYMGNDSTHALPLLNLLPYYSKGLTFTEDELTANTVLRGIGNLHTHILGVGALSPDGKNTLYSTKCGAIPDNCLFTFGGGVNENANPDPEETVTISVSDTQFAFPVLVSRISASVGDVEQASDQLGQALSSFNTFESYVQTNGEPAEQQRYLDIQSALQQGVSSGFPYNTLYDEGAGAEFDVSDFIQESFFTDIVYDEPQPDGTTISRTITAARQLELVNGYLQSHVVDDMGNYATQDDDSRVTYEEHINNFIQSEVFDAARQSQVNFEMAYPLSDSELMTRSYRDYQAQGGTSFASPLVTGGLALLKSKFSGLTNAQVVARLLETATYEGLETLERMIIYDPRDDQMADLVEDDFKTMVLRLRDDSTTRIKIIDGCTLARLGTTLDNGQACTMDYLRAVFGRGRADLARAADFVGVPTMQTLNFFDGDAGIDLAANRLQVPSNVGREFMAQLADSSFITFDSYDGAHFTTSGSAIFKTDLSAVAEPLIGYGGASSVSYDNGLSLGSSGGLGFSQSSNLVALNSARGWGDKVGFMPTSGLFAGDASQPWQQVRYDHGVSDRLSLSPFVVFAADGGVDNAKSRGLSLHYGDWRGASGDTLWLASYSEGSVALDSHVLGQSYSDTQSSRLDVGVRYLLTDGGVELFARKMTTSLEDTIATPTRWGFSDAALEQSLMGVEFKGLDGLGRFSLGVYDGGHYSSGTANLVVATGRDPGGLIFYDTRGFDLTVDDARYGLFLAGEHRLEGWVSGDGDAKVNVSLQADSDLSVINRADVGLSIRF